MKFELRFEELEELRDEMTGAIDELQIFEDSFKNLLANITEETKNKAIDSVEEKSQEIVEQFNSLREAFEIQTEALEGYIDGHEAINEPEQGKEYILYTSPIKRNNKNTIRNLEILEDISKNYVMEEYIAEYTNKKYKFEGLLLSRVLMDYEGKQEKQDYIKMKDLTISEKINSFNKNVNIIEDVVESLIKFEDKAEEAIGELERFNDRIKEITDFEEGYNPGFFDKHVPEVVNDIIIRTSEVSGSDIIMSFFTDYDAYYEGLFGGLIYLGQEKFAELFLSPVGLFMEKFLKGIDIIGGMDGLYVIIHSLQYGFGTISTYEFQKQIVGDFGAMLGGSLGKLAGGAIGTEFGGVGAVPGVIIGSVAGSIEGEIIAEELFESIFDEENYA